MRAILIDDEQLALNYLEYQLSNHSDVEIIGKFIDPIEGRQAIEENEVDIVFLDIEIPSLNGIELAEQLLETKPELHIIFVTAYGEYATKAFELNALDYVLKPVGQERLHKTIQRVKSRMKEQGSVRINDTSTLYINLFKEFSMSDDQQNILLRWRTTKAQQLFLFLLHHRQQTVNKTAIIELLWPDLELERAYQQLYSTIYHIRKTLAPFANYFEIKSTSEGYRLLMKQTVLDVDRFEQFIRSELQLSKDTLRYFEQAMQLVPGEYLQDYDYVWAESERQRFLTMWMQTALDVVSWYYDYKEYDKALTLCLDLCKRHPLEEEAHFFLMKIFAALGRRTSVHKQYEQLKKLLMDEIQVEPMPDITDWYQQWRQENED